jgi:hypothetical protein
MTYRHPEFAYPASRLRDLHPLHRLRSVRPGQQRFPNPWPLLPQIPGLPSFRFTRLSAARRFPRSTTRSIRRSLPTGVFVLDAPTDASPPAPRGAAPAASQVPCLGPTSSEPSCRPFGPSARARVPSMPSADFCMPMGSDSSSLSSPHWRTACSSPRVRHRPFRA